MASMTVSGIISGIDWEGMISTMIEKAQQPAQVQINKRINLTNKKTLFEEMQELAEKLQKSTTALRLESTYKAKKVEAERVDSNGSSKGVLTAKVNAEAEAGVHTIKVSQLAQAATKRSDRVTDASAILSEYKDSTLWFSQNGQKVGVKVGDTTSLEGLSSKINNAIKTQANPMNFTASVVDNRLIFRSDNAGLGTMNYTDTATYSSGSYSTRLEDLKSIDMENLQDGDFVITDNSGNEYKNGVDFDVMSDGEIRWRQYSKSGTVAPGATYGIKYTAAVGDKYTTNKITRGSGNVDRDVLNFTPNITDTIADRVVIKDNEGYEYKYGTDFTFSVTQDDDGNTIRSVVWSKAIGASKPDEGQTYTVSYTAGGEFVSARLSSTTNGVLIEDPSGTFVQGGKNYISYSQIKDYVNESTFYLEDDNGTRYIYGKDFTIYNPLDTNPSGRDIPALRWLSGGNRPTAPAGYTGNTWDLCTAYCMTEGSEVFDIDVTRSNTDATGVAYSDTTFANKTVTVKYSNTERDGTTTEKTYYNGIDFDIVNNNGNAEISWRPEAAATAPLSYYYNQSTNYLYQLNVTEDTLTGADYNTLQQGTSVITSGNDTWREGVDFDIVKGTGNEAIVTWRTNSVQNAPDNYTLTFTPDNGGTSRSYSGTRTTNAVSGNLNDHRRDNFNPKNYGFDTTNGTVTGVTYDGTTYQFNSIGRGAPQTALGVIATKNNNSGVTTLHWYGHGTRTQNTNLPADGAQLTISYKYRSNLFSIDDGGSGLLDALGLNNNDEDHMTAAQDALISVDGEEWNLVSNELEYDNDILKGVSLELKGTGTVIVDVTHDTDKAVENVQTFIDDFNVLMDWINVRSTEKEVNSLKSSDDETLSSLTRSGDDFNTSWGLLYGNSYLRSTKSGLRSVVSQNFSFNFRERTGSKPVYGTMAFNGLQSNTNLRISVGDRYANITIEPGDTIYTIADKINKTGGTNEYDNEAYRLHYDDDGNEIAAVRARVVNDRLVLTRGSSAEANGSEITISGSTAMNLLNLNYTYKGLYQIGIETTSDNYGISGQLDFSPDEFREALEDDPEEVQTLMTAFAKQMDAYMKSMLNSSSTSSGTLKMQISNLDTQIKDIDDYLDDFQDRLDRMEARLRTQYAAAEERIAQLTQQANSISGILNQLNSSAASNGGN